MVYLLFTGTCTSAFAHVAESLAAKMDDPKLIKRTMSLVKELHNSSSDELEIMATLVFLQRSEHDISNDKLIDRVQELKPRFDRDQIAKSIKVFNILKNFGYA